MWKLYLILFKEISNNYVNFFFIEILQFREEQWTKNNNLKISFFN